jgi:Rrf2 family protein
MQLTRAADYAVRVMIHLATQPEGAVVSRTFLARAAEAPESFLSKILQALARAGLIQARRGVSGGFSLLSRGAEASLLDVVECIDGPVALNVCVTSGASCHRQPECAAHQVWLRAQSAMLSVLREAKIAEMVPAQQSCRDLLHIAELNRAPDVESNRDSLRGNPPVKPVTTTHPRSAAAGARRFQQNTKN